MRKTHVEHMFSYFESQLNVKFDSLYTTKLKQLDDRITELATEAKTIPKYNKYYDSMEFDTYHVFLNSDARIYRLCEDFSKDLYKVNLVLPVSFIPIFTECICVEFPEWFHAKHSNGKNIKSVFIFQTNWKKSSGEVYRGLRLQFPDYDDNGNWMGTITFIHMELSPEKKLDEIIEETPYKESEDFGINIDAINFAIKSYVYIHSGEPDLRFEKHIPLPQTKKEKKLRHFLRDNVGKLVNFFQVGYNYKKRKIYYVDGIEVSGHIRWQPYGPSRQKVKLIWIDPYTKTNLNKLI